ncbi:His Kinase A (phospho-acceptor) domain-containing protein [Noviherbaspirillum humi]|uniref:histidine kinase n=1 Tax=Noviherbaspirillum humi TaxID=1688639 RepID=A0A239EXG8_9BURK|nr:ATP-binding protein [Noviherbaspirillum humi]SNS49305.1 His Kinase A (phospho-acceptor) domain-containing protein [Noviherbaspirillum humi]
MFTKLRSLAGRLAFLRNRYAFAAVIVIAAGVLRHALNPLLGETEPFLFLALPVAVMAIRFGLAGAVVTGVMAALAGSLLVLGSSEPIIHPLYGAAHLLSFSGVCAGMGFLAWQVRAERGRNALQAEELASAMRQVQERDAQLRHADLQKEAAEQQKNEFISMLGHELRNPLAGMSTAADLLPFVRENERRHAQTTDVIARQVRHMTKLVDDILDVSRISRGMITVSKRPMDFVVAINEAVEQACSVISERQHRLTLQLPDAPVWVEGDQTRLVQVVANLLANSAKYTPEGGDIVVRLDVCNGEVGLSVQDNGMGINAELLPFIFDSFVQAKRTADRSQGGLGLGLAIVKSIVTLHGGRASAYSDGLGRGSVFAIHLPSAADHGQRAVPQQAPAPQAAQRRASGGLELLVVDDNEDAARGLSLLLSSQGHQVTTLFNPRRALERARVQAFDAMILDIGMPEMDGYALAKHIRAMGRHADTTLIALTGYGTEDDIRQAREAGFDHHFTKPVDAARLAMTLQQIPAMRSGHAAKAAAA